MGILAKGRPAMRLNPPRDVGCDEVCVALQRSMELNKRRFAASQLRGCRMKAANSPELGSPELDSLDSGR